MLVVFTNKSGGTVDMFEKAALNLIKLMGRREAVPSAISAQELPEALDTLQRALIEIEQIEKAVQAEPESDDDEEEEDKPQPIAMGARAFPLIELIQQTIKDGSYLMWDYK